ncbi:hypothetical protein [Porticoccus sp.]
MESHKVVARFLVSWLSYGLISVRATHDTEVRDNTERKLTDAQLRRARDMLSHFTS